MAKAMSSERANQYAYDPLNDDGLKKCELKREKKGRSHPSESREWEEKGNPERRNTARCSKKKLQHRIGGRGDEEVLELLKEGVVGDFNRGATSMVSGKS